MDREKSSHKDIADFAARVREELQHLDAELVAELMSDLEANVAASVDDGSPIPDASEYVAALLAAAGLDAPSSRPKKKFIPVVPLIRKYLFGLAPIWWFVRAFIAIVILSAVTSNASSNGSRFPLFRVFGSSWTAAVLFGLLLWASISLGRQHRPKHSKVTELIGILTVVTGLVVAFMVAERDFNTSRDWAVQYREYCADSTQGTVPGLRILPDVSKLPNVVGMTAPEVEMAIKKWSNGTAQMMFEQSHLGPMIDYETAIAVRQDPPQLHELICIDNVVIPVWFENSSAVMSSTSLPTVIQPGPTSIPTDDGLYVIQKGDSPQSIALRFGITVNELLELNGWETEAQFPYPDTVIKIPVPASNR